MQPINLMGRGNAPKTGAQVAGARMHVSLGEPPREPQNAANN